MRIILLFIMVLLTSCTHHRTKTLCAYDPQCYQKNTQQHGCPPCPPCNNYYECIDHVDKYDCRH